MATFHIDIGDGDVREIRADTEQKALDLAKTQGKDFPKVVYTTETDNGRVLLRDGKKYFVSDGFSSSEPEDIKKIQNGAEPADISRSSFNQGILDEAEKQSPLGRATGPLVAVGQAMGLGAGGFLDEGVDYIANTRLGQALGFTDKSGDAIRSIYDAQSQERPGETMLLQGATGLAEGYGVARKIPQLADALTGSRRRGLLQSMLTGGVSGAAAGAASGALQGAAQTNPGDSRIAGAKEGAKIGGGIGAGFGVAAPPLAAGGRNIAEIIRRSDVPLIAAALRISNEAAMVIKDAFQRGGDIDSAVAGIQRAGEQGTLADAGYAAQALLDATAASSEQAGQQIRDSLETRAKAVSSDLNETLNKTLGNQELTPSNAYQMIADTTRDQRQKAYDLAYKTQIDYASPQGIEIENILSRIDQDILDPAIKRANSRMKFEQKDKVQDGYRAIKATFDDDGNVTFSDLPNMMQLDYIKKALGELAENARGEFGKRTPDSDMFGNMAFQLRNAINRANPSYGKAVKLGGEKIQDENAFTIGRNLLKPNVELGDVLDELGPEPTDSQIELAKLGMRNYIRTVLDNVRKVPSDMNREARELDQFLRLTTSENARRKISALMGDEADELFRQIEEVGQTALVRTATNVNSKTQQRKAIADRIDNLTEYGIVGQLLRGEPINSSKQIVQSITGMTNEFNEQRKRAIYDDIAFALTKTHGKRANQVLETVRAALDGRIITQEQNDALVRSLAAAITIAGRDEATRQNVRDK